MLYLLQYKHMPKLLEQNIKKAIADLRKKGHSIPEISQILNISKTSAYRHAIKIPILPKYKQRWLNRRNASKIMSNRSWEIAEKQAESLINSLNNKERLLVVCALYWAEGNKADLSFTNTDPEMIAIFMDTLRSEFNISNSEFKISIRIYEDLDKNECIRHWSSITKIDLNNNVSINVLSGKKTGKLKFGMCRVRVKKGGLLLKKISAINKQITKIISPHSSTDRIRHS